MTKPTNPNPGVPPAPAGASPTGFDLCERVLVEFRDLKRSPSLIKWATQLKTGLEQFATENRVPRAAKEAQAVENAFMAANELCEVMRKEAADRSKSK